MTAKTFGKRATATPAPPRRAAKAVEAASAPHPAAAPRPQKLIVEAKPVVAEAPPPVPSVDDELRQWKEERRKGLFFRLPWKQFSLFASISFGVASFVLPDDVNDAVNYLLWGLSLISFAIWISGFFNKKTP